MTLFKKSTLQGYADFHILTEALSMAFDTNTLTTESLLSTPSTIFPHDCPQLIFYHKLPGIEDKSYT